MQYNSTFARPTYILEKCNCIHGLGYMLWIGRALVSKAAWLHRFEPITNSLQCSPKLSYALFKIKSVTVHSATRKITPCLMSTSWKYKLWFKCIFLIQFITIIHFACDNVMWQEFFYHYSHTYSKQIHISWSSISHIIWVRIWFWDEFLCYICVCHDLQLV
jgi:hypothetical protein